MAIIYDTSYVFRGNTGIPYDARSLLNVLRDRDDSQFLLFPKIQVTNFSRSLFGNPIDTGLALRSEHGPDFIGRRLRLALTTASALFGKKDLKTYEFIYNEENVNIRDLFGLESSIRISSISSEKRWMRTLFRKPYMIKLKEGDIYIQQHIDPIQIPKKATGIFRLHDILPITNPQFFSNQAVSLFLRGLNSLKDQNVLWVMDCKSNAQEFRRVVNPHGNITVIPCEISGDVFEQQIIRKPEKRITLVGTIEPRKNVDKVLNAFLTLRDLKKISNDWRLTILGSKGWLSDSLHSQIKELARLNVIEYIDSPSRSLVLSTISNSQILISASSAEGFGLPPLEGLALGARVLVSDIPQHRENLGNKATYFSPHKIDECTSALEKLCRKTLHDSTRLENREYVFRNYSFSSYARKWNSLLSSIQVGEVEDSLSYF